MSWIATYSAAERPTRYIHRIGVCLKSVIYKWACTLGKWPIKVWDPSSICFLAYLHSIEADTRSFTEVSAQGRYIQLHVLSGGWTFPLSRKQEHLHDQNLWNTWLHSPLYSCAPPVLMSHIRTWGDVAVTHTSLHTSVFKPWGLQVMFVSLVRPLRSLHVHTSNKDCMYGVMWPQGYTH